MITSNAGQMQQLPSLMIVMAVIGLAPFIIVMVTSFAKMVVVMSLVRNALGTQQTPSNMVVNGLAIILSIYVMAPVGSAMKDIMDREHITVDNAANFSKKLPLLVEPLRKFMAKHTNSKERIFFVKSATSGYFNPPRPPLFRGVSIQARCE